MKDTHTIDESEIACDVHRYSDIAVDEWSRWNVGRIRIFGIFVHSKFLVLLLAELVVLTVATYYSYTQPEFGYPESTGWLLAKSLFAAAPFIMCFAGLGLYSSRQTLSGIDLLYRYTVASAIIIPIQWVLHLFLRAGVTVVDYVGPVALAILLLVGFRMMFGFLLNSNLLKRRVLVIGGGAKALFIEQIANDPNQRGFSLAHVNPDLSVAGALVKCVKRNRINEVVVAFDDRRNTLPAKELLDCRLSGVSVVEVLDFLERETGVIPFEHLQPSWLIYTDGFNSNVFSRAAKRAFDIVASAALIVLTMPITLLTCIAIKLDGKSPGAILYKQVRVGLAGENFQVLKFRSMCADAETGSKAIWAIEHDPRITAVGAVIRKYRIDELPQLFNVLMGSMSLVGPRPERPEFVGALNGLNNLYTERHRTRPGVTGWAQIRFPYTDNENDSIRKLQYDMFYLKQQGFFFDLYILLQTIEVVLFGKGAR